MVELALLLEERGGRGERRDLVYVVWCRVVSFRVESSDHW